MRTSVLLGLFLIIAGVIALVAADADQAFAPRICKVNDRWSCGGGQYCATSKGKCGDDKGTCVDKPEVCNKIYKPVCGCDGNTYGNECEARSKGVSIKAEGACPPREPCPELKQLCARMSATADAFDAELYANQGAGAPLPYRQVDWYAVKRLITKDFQWEDYSVFSSAGIYKDIETYWKALNRANSKFPLKNLVLQWETCDPFSKRLVTQYQETFVRSDDDDKKDGNKKDKDGNKKDKDDKETSTSLYVIEFDEDERGGLKIKREAYWTSGNLLDLVRPKRNNNNNNGHNDGHW